MDTSKLWFDSYNVPKKPNEKAMGEYLTSKQESKTIPRLYDRGDAIDRDIRAGCYLAHKKLDKIETRLRKKREVAVGTRKSLDKQWAELSRKEEELRELFNKFNRFVIENAEKRERACNNLEDQNRINVYKIIEMEQLSHDCKEMDFMYRKIDEIVQQYWIFETYLATVVEKDLTFQNPKDILKRYEALVYTKETLNSYQQGISDKLDQLKTEYCKLIDGYCVKLAGLHVRLTDLHQRYESTKLNALKWEKLLLSIRSDATEKIMDLTAIKESSRRMYREICERKGIEPVFMNDYGKQFDYIKEALYDLGCINKMVRALEEEKLTLSEKPCVSSETDLTEDSNGVLSGK